MTDIQTFTKEHFGTELTEAQLDLLRAHAEAMADGKQLVMVKRRALGKTHLNKVIGEYLKQAVAEASHVTSK